MFVRNILRKIMEIYTFLSNYVCDFIFILGLSLSLSACSAELEEGLYVLKKKSLDDSEFPVIRKPNKRRPSKKGRKQSVVGFQ